MTFKRYHHEAGLTDADYDFLLPLSDPTTALPALHLLRRDSKIFCTDTTSNAAVSTPLACARTFGTAELAEAIFLLLPAQTLLCKAQRVCRTWRDFVQRNELIQQYLFLAPIRSEHRPLTSKARLEFEHLDGALICKHENTEERRTDGHSVIENPWLYLFSAAYPDSQPCWPEPSWKGMLLSQPPCGRVVYGTVADKIAYLSDDDDFRPLGPFPRVIEDPVAWAKPEPRFVTLGDLDMDRSSLNGIKDWSSWRPQLDWETLRQAKHGGRRDEVFVEFELAAVAHDH